MAKQKDQSIREDNCGEWLNSVPLLSLAIKEVPDIFEDLIDEMDLEVEREVIQRYMCRGPEYDLEPNTIRHIAKCLNISKRRVISIIDKFKKIIWSRLNG